MLQVKVSMSTRSAQFKLKGYRPLPPAAVLASATRSAAKDDDKLDVFRLRRAEDV